MRLKRFMF